MHILFLNVHKVCKSNTCPNITFRAARNYVMSKSYVGKTGLITQRSQPQANENSLRRRKFYRTRNYRIR